MEKLRQYLNSLSLEEQTAYAERCGTTIGYLRTAISAGKRIGEKIAIALERESGGEVRCESICPDTDWQYIRNSADHAEARVG